ncbi:MAG: DUF4843 domain-containing protein, partial [Saprospiraceae bacterium]
TLTSRKHHSGTKSSKCGQGAEYSITFESLIDSLNEFSKEVSIDFYLFQETLVHNAKLVIEVSGERMEFNWHGKAITELSQVTNEWTKVNYTYLLPKNYFSGQKIKIYLYNVSNIPLYMDDVNIEFKE